ncbi:MAG: KaiB domain protein [Actinomycetia bacterium]|nr:KaiB domain protein [Actinomycetes bacterium]
MTGKAAADGLALTLYVDGAATSSMHAIEIVRRFCDEQLGGHAELEVIDVHQQPELAARDQIVAAPTLVRRLPGPPRRIVGDLSDTAWMRLGLDLGPAELSGAPSGPDE